MFLTWFLRQLSRTATTPPLSDPPPELPADLPEDVRRLCLHIRAQELHVRRNQRLLTQLRGQLYSRVGTVAGSKLLRLITTR